MNGRLAHLFQAAGIVAVLSQPALAHHSAANYDLSKEVDVTGTVTAWMWQNPHCVLQLDTTDSSGAVRHWAVEVQNPTSMSNRGWSRRSFSVGDRVTVSLHPGRQGEPIGLATKVLLPSGKTLIADPMGQADAAATPITAK